MIRRRVRKLGAEITARLREEEITVVASSTAPCCSRPICCAK